MDKIVYIPELETPALFQYPPSRIALQGFLPLALYFALIFNVTRPTVFSPTDLLILFSLHTGLLAILAVFVNRRFPMRIQFHAGHLVFEPFFGRGAKVPYEDLHAVMETPLLVIFALKKGKRLVFIPAQTSQQDQFKKVLQILYHALQEKAR